MKKLFLILYTLLICNNLSSQNLPTIVPPSPEASALAKFTNVPVSYYTGLPNISVPIYTIQQKGISIPIGLSYHARGVQVSEIASRTGLGWSLQYGGSISRQVRGKADEHPEYGYLSNGSSFMAYSTSIETRGSVHSIESNHPDYDFYPDQFSFSAGDISGKFVLDYATGEPVIQSFDDVIIIRSGMESFIIIDSRGNTYYFGKSKDGDRAAQDYENSTGKSVYVHGVVDDPITASFDFFSSWKLMDIETTKGELISYYYESENGDNIPSVYYRKSYDKHDNDPGGVTNSVTNMTDIQKIHTRISQVSNYEKQLSKISFNQGRDSVVFIKSNNLRDDFEGHSLERISIYNQNKLIKSFKLNYSYTTSTDQSNLLWYFTKAQGSNLFEKYLKRMFLANIEEEGSDGQKLPPYVFTYDSQILPNAFSSKQDYWGYYNGATNNGPFTRPFNYGNYDVDRRVDTLKSEAGILKEIQYPTGGKAKFTYEHNKGYLPTEMSHLKKPEINPSSIGKVVKVLTKADFLYSLSNSYAPLEVQLPPSTKITYNIFCNRFRDAEDPMTTPDCIFIFTLDGQIINTGEDVVIFTGSSFNYDGTSSIGVHPISHPDLDSSFHRNEDIDFQITITYDLETSFIYGAGKRIKKVEMISQVGDTIAKEYEYNFPVDDVYFSKPTPSGAIIGLPTYLNRAENTLNIYTHYNDASSAYSSFQPNSIGYSSVIEYHGTKQNNIGKTEYVYTNLSDSGGDYYEFPYHPPTDNEWLRGKNIETKIYKKENSGIYTKVKEIYNKYLYGDNEYEVDFLFAGFLHGTFIFTPSGGNYDWNMDSPFDHIKSRTFFKMPLFMRQRNPLPSEGYPTNYVSGYRTYYLTGGTQHILRTVEKDYYDNGTVNTTTSENFFDYDKHYQITKTKSFNSKGDIIINKILYPNNKSEIINLTPSASFAIDKLITQNQIAQPIQSETYMDINNNGDAEVNELLSTQRTNFKVWNNKIILPEIIQTSKGIKPLEDRIVYHDYFSNGNVKEVSKEDGTHVVYIWGYNETQPIAKIENANFVDIPTVNYDEIISKSDLDNDNCREITCKEQELRDVLNNLRNPLIAPNLSKSQITTYTYDPLIGVTSITDPRGETIYYHYDNFNRLEYVKDAQGKILSENEYHYKNQQ